MRTLSAVLVATAFTIAGVASAQMKPPAQQPATSVSSSPVVMSTEPPLEAAKRIPREDAIKMIKEHKAVWIDVRPRDQYDQGHIAGALSFPLAELPEKMKDLPKNKYLITYCA